MIEDRNETPSKSVIVVILALLSPVPQIIEKMNGQGVGAEVIPFSVTVKAQGNIEDWLSDLLFKMQVIRHMNLLAPAILGRYFDGTLKKNVFEVRIGLKGMLPLRVEVRLLAVPSI